MSKYTVQELKEELDKLRQKLLSKTSSPSESETKKVFCDFIEYILERMGLRDYVSSIRIDKYLRISGKRMFTDVSYRSMIVEIEPYGVLTRDPVYDVRTAYAIVQAVKYMFGEAEEQRISLDKIRGFVTDLRLLIVLRYIPISTSGGDIDYLKETVIQITHAQDLGGDEYRNTILSKIRMFFDIKYYNLEEESEAIYGVEELVNAILGQVKPLLNVDALVKVFGIDERRCTGSTIVRNVVKILYSMFKEYRRKDQKIQEAFEFWNQLFVGMAGYNLESLRRRRNWECLYRAYGFGSEPDVKEFFFILHTLVSLIAKLIAYELISLVNPLLRTDPRRKPLAIFSDLDSDEIKAIMEDIEYGRIFEDAGIHGFLVGDPFKWYLLIWNDKIAYVVKTIAKELGKYDFAPLVINPWLHRDVLKRLYQNIVPRRIRHDLGEYYTPDWLAQYLLNRLGEVSPKVIREVIDGDGKVVDPACGSGTFLLEIIKLIVSRSMENILRVSGSERGEIAFKTLRSIVSRVIGFDINPVATIIAKINYLLALSPILYEVYTSKISPDIEIPIYISDTIIVPSLDILASKDKIVKQETLDKWVSVRDVNGYIVEIPRPFTMKIPVIKGKGLRKLFENIRRRIQYLRDVGRDNIVDLVRHAIRDSDLEDIITSRQEEALVELVDQVISRNSMWLSILTDFFTPLAYLNYFNMVIGNPPWVNWVNIPDDYKSILEKIADYYGLKAGALGRATVDISAIMTYVAIDKFLSRENGVIGFLITQSIFQSTAGSGFRKFSIKGVPVGVKVVEDLVEIRPFERATNRTALFIAVKGEKTQYPIEYRKWMWKEGAEGLDKDLFSAYLNEVLEITQWEVLEARPIQSSDLQSVWVVLPPGQYDRLRRLFKQSPYSAHKGVNFSVTGAFWVRIIGLGSTSDSIVVETYVSPRSRIRVDIQRKEIEKALVYPLLRGIDLRKWYVNINVYTILPLEIELRRDNGRISIIVSEIDSEDYMVMKYSRTYEYLERYKDVILSVRQEPYKTMFGQGRKPFFWLFNAKPALHPYKVVWRYIGRRLNACAIALANDPYVGLKPIVPYEKVVYIPVDSIEEAYYLAGVLNSTFINALVTTYTIETQRAPHILEKIFIPRYSDSIETHKLIAEASRTIHELARKGRTTEIKEKEEELEELVYQLYSEELGIDQSVLRNFINKLVGL